MKRKVGKVTELTLLEGRAVFRVLAAAVMDPTLPLSALRECPEDKGARTRALKKLKHWRRIP